jgi:hypothetical protein
VQVVVLNREREPSGGELSTELLEKRRKGSEATTFVGPKRQLTIQKIGVANRQRRDRKRRDAVSDVVVGVDSLTALKFGEQREHMKPGPGSVAKLAKGNTGVRE